MPFSIQFTAKFESILYKCEARSYIFEVIICDEETRLMPLFDCAHLIMTALELGFINPIDEIFWKAELQNKRLPYPNHLAGKVLEFCQMNVTFQLVHPHSLQRGTELLIGVRKYDGSGQTLFLPGVITEVLSVRIAN